MEQRVQFRLADLQFAPQQVQQTLGVGAEDVGDGHLAGAVLVEDDGVAGDGLLAVGEGVERLDGLFLRGVGGQRQLDFDVLRGEVVDAFDLQLLFLDGVLDARGKRFGGLAEGKLADHDLVLVAGLDDRAHPELAESVVVFARIEQPARHEIREELEGLLLEDGDLRLQQLDEVVRHDVGRKADGDTGRADHQEQGDFRGQEDGFLVPSVVTGHERGGLLVEKFLAGEVGEAALDVTGGCGGGAGEDVAEIPLSPNQVSLALFLLVIAAPPSSLARTG